jgi:hypothetical protein
VLRPGGSNIVGSTNVTLHAGGIVCEICIFNTINIDGGAFLHYPQDKRLSNGNLPYRSLSASGGEWRTFSFTAHTDSSNNTSGQAELPSRASDLRVHMVIDCLQVVGNTATMSGAVTLVNDNASGIIVGDPIWFRVVDNGSGANSQPDLISRVAFFSGPGIPCTDDSSTPPTPANIPIEAGNVTVH